MPHYQQKSNGLSTRIVISYLCLKSISTSNLKFFLKNLSNYSDHAEKPLKTYAASLNNRLHWAVNMRAPAPVLSFYPLIPYQKKSQ